MVAVVKTSQINAKDISVKKRTVKLEHLYLRKATRIITTGY